MKSALSNMDSTSTRTPGWRALMRSRAARPSMPGMEMSVTTTSGRTDSSTASSSSPSRASATTFTPGIPSRMALMPVRTRSWSSARTTSMVSTVGECIGTAGEGAFL
jgi:hypothetical protein